ncbi:MAG: flagellar hook-length control protein FliK [Alphaproteobacteria bacterium]|nr:flagellar hook-length control protein FliK [Alphaproteobacteria bacterium]
MANIATVTAVSKATSSNVPADAGAKAPAGPDILFAALLQQLAQSAAAKATPANDAAPAQNDNAADAPQTNARPANPIAMLQTSAKSAAGSATADANLPENTGGPAILPLFSAPQPAAANAVADAGMTAAATAATTEIKVTPDAAAAPPPPASGDAPSVPAGKQNDAADAKTASSGNANTAPAQASGDAPLAAAPDATPDPAQLVPGNAPSAPADKQKSAAVSKPANGTESKNALSQVVTSGNLKAASDATAAPLQPVQGGAVSAAKTPADKQDAATVSKTAADNNSKSAATPKAAQDPAVLAALMSAPQAQALQPAKSGGQTSGAKPGVDAVTGTKPSGSATGPKATPASAADQSPADSAAVDPASGKPADVSIRNNTKQSSGTTAPAKSSDGGKIAKDNPAGTQSAPSHQAAPAAQASSSGSSNSPPATSVAASGVQAGPAASASPTAPAANLQVVPQHHDAMTSSQLGALGLTIAAKSHDGIKHFDIRMDPPELGGVQVRLSVDNSGKTQATLIVDRPQTLQLLQNDSANLARSLADAGVNLSNNGLNFSLRSGQERQNGNGSSSNGRSRALTVNAVAGTDANSHSNPIASLAPDGVRLDIRV